MCTPHYSTQVETKSPELEQIKAFPNIPKPTRQQRTKGVSRVFLGCCRVLKQSVEGFFEGLSGVFGGVCWVGFLGVSFGSF